MAHPATTLPEGSRDDGSPHASTRSSRRSWRGRRRPVVAIAIGVAAAAIGVLAVAQTMSDEFRAAWGLRYAPNNQAGVAASSAATRPRHPQTAAERVRYWSRLAVDASGLDHAAPAPGETRAFGQQLGPGRSARAMAIVHIAMFEALNAIDRRYQPYLDLPRTFALPRGAADAAVAQAAHDTLVSLFSAQATHLDARLAEDLGRIRHGGDKAAGIALGRGIAAAILARRAGDGAQHPEPRVGVDHITSDDPGKWRQDPISQVPLAMGAHWAKVQPFVLRSADQFRAPPPPDMTSEAYAVAYDEVRRLGGDGVRTPTERTEDQTFAGIYWAYDGTPSLCAPPRLYNQVALTIADRQGTSGNALELARLLALVNVALADAGVAIWESKFHYNIWRPITGIREADERTGPTGLGDGNAATRCDPGFMPLGAPASNLAGPNFTPPFPSYPSGHAGFGGALFQILRAFYGTDAITFTFVSDEYNGVTRDNSGALRPLLPRTFSTLSQAEEENGQSRIYLGLHWSFDKTEGISQGRRIADYVFANLFTPCEGRACGAR